MEEKIKSVILEDLLQKGVTHSRDGTPVNELTPRQLKEEAAIVSFRDINVESSSNTWF